MMKKRWIVLAVLIAVLLAAEWQVKSNYTVSSVSADGHWQIANYANITDPKNTWDGVIYYYGSDAPHSIAIQTEADSTTRDTYTLERDSDQLGTLTKLSLRLAQGLSGQKQPSAMYPYLSMSEPHPNLSVSIFGENNQPIATIPSP